MRTVCWSLCHSAEPAPCIHYIWSPTDPAFTISNLPQYTEHGNAII
ncbi:unnamed protein product [Staurois parvus]|uniref:Uncharacterized protein n=1 Tax=Staurois parvus TaxID=386267 RepID=A0ABN9E4L8_9NEOB|nr:unnamed protein product [Staurois parvus]